MVKRKSKTSVAAQPKSTARLTKRVMLSCMHELRSPKLSEEENLRIFGKCTNLHGHNYYLEVTVEGAIDPRSGLCCNRDLFDKKLESVFVKPYNGKNLNGFFKNTTGEILAQEFFKIARRKFKPLKVVSLRVQETPKNAFKFALLSLATLLLLTLLPSNKVLADPSTKPTNLPMESAYLQWLNEASQSLTKAHEQSLSSEDTDKNILDSALNPSTGSLGSYRLSFALEDKKTDGKSCPQSAVVKIEIDWAGKPDPTLVKSEVKTNAPSSTGPVSCKDFISQKAFVKALHEATEKAYRQIKKLRKQNEPTQTLDNPDFERASKTIK